MIRKTVLKILRNDSLIRKICNFCYYSNCWSDTHYWSDSLKELNIRNSSIALGDYNFGDFELQYQICLTWFLSNCNWLLW